MDKNIIIIFLFTTYITNINKLFSGYINNLYLQIGNIYFFIQHLRFHKILRCLSNPKQL